MRINTRRGAGGLVKPSNDPEKIVRSNMARSSTALVAAESGDDRPTAQDENTSIGTSCIAYVFATGEVAGEVIEKIAAEIQSSKELRLDASETKSEATEMSSWTIDQALERLHVRVLQLTKQTIVDTLEKCNSYVNKPFIRHPIDNALHDPLSTVLHGNGIAFTETFEKAVVHFTNESAQSQSEAVATFYVSDDSFLAAIKTFVVGIAEKAIACALKTEVSVVLRLRSRQDREFSRPLRRAVDTSEVRRRRGRQDTTANGPERRQELTSGRPGRLCKRVTSVY